MSLQITEDNPMRNTIITLITASLMTLLVISPVHAASKSSKEEAIGISSGALIGAAAGGPVGFFIGTARCQAR